MEHGLSRSTLCLSHFCQNQTGKQTGFISHKQLLTANTRFTLFAVAQSWGSGAYKLWCFNSSAPARCSRQRQCVKLPAKFPSSPGLHGVASASPYKMSQFHTSKIQEPSFSTGTCDSDTHEMYLYCIYPHHFHIRETCQQFVCGDR